MGFSICDLVCFAGHQKTLIRILFFLPLLFFPALFSSSFLLFFFFFCFLFFNEIRSGYAAQPGPTLLGSSNPWRVAGTTGRDHCTWLLGTFYSSIASLSKPNPSRHSDTQPQPLSIWTWMEILSSFLILITQSFTHTQSTLLCLGVKCWSQDKCPSFHCPHFKFISFCVLLCLQGNWWPVMISGDKGKPSVSLTQEFWIFSFCLGRWFPNNAFLCSVTFVKQTLSCQSITVEGTCASPLPPRQNVQDLPSHLET